MLPFPLPFPSRPQSLDRGNLGSRLPEPAPQECIGQCVCDKKLQPRLLMGEPGSRYCPRINVLSLREQAMAREQAASSSSIIHGPWGDVVGATPAIRGFACWRRAQSTVKKLAIRIRYFVPAQSTGFHVVQSQLQSQLQVGNRPRPARLRQVFDDVARSEPR